jgi:hypothetical protein
MGGDGVRIPAEQSVPTHPEQLFIVTHIRSLVTVDAASSYSHELHGVAGVHTRLEVPSGGTVAKVEPATHCVEATHTPRTG